MVQIANPYHIGISSEVPGGDQPRKKPRRYMRGFHMRLSIQSMPAPWAVVCRGWNLPLAQRLIFVALHGGGNARPPLKYSAPVGIRLVRNGF